MTYLPLDRESGNSYLAVSTSTLTLGSITILVVDDHALVRSAIGRALDMESEVKLVAVAHDYVSAEEQVVQVRPDIIWLDMHIARCDGIAEIRRLRKLAPDARIMALADEENEQEAFEAIMAGAQGYCSKQDIDTDDIMTMIHMIWRGEFVLSPVLLTRLM